MLSGVYTKCHRVPYYSTSPTHTHTTSAVTELPLCANTLTLFTDSQTESAECVCLCPQHDQTIPCSPSFTSLVMSSGLDLFISCSFLSFMCTPHRPLSDHSAGVKLNRMKRAQMHAWLVHTFFVSFLFLLEAFLS